MTNCNPVEKCRFVHESASSLALFLQKRLWRHLKQPIHYSRCCDAGACGTSATRELVGLGGITAAFRSRPEPTLAGHARSQTGDRTRGTSRSRRAPGCTQPAHTRPSEAVYIFLSAAYARADVAIGLRPWRWSRVALPPDEWFAGTFDIGDDAGRTAVWRRKLGPGFTKGVSTRAWTVIEWCTAARRASGPTQEKDGRRRS